MRILFVDPSTPKPYCKNTLETEPLGGTEATCVRLAQALKLRGHEVEVAQHNRTEAVERDGVWYTPFGHKRAHSPSHVIVLRQPMALYTARKQYPSAKLYFWAHDIFTGENWDKGFQAFVDNQTVPIVVSEWHKSQMQDMMHQVKFKGQVPCRRIYNPIDNDLRPDDTVKDPKKLVFFSSPHKGLEHTLSVFKNFENFPELKDMKLYIANPVYFPSHEADMPNVVNLGTLPHAEVIKHVREAMCVFHLNAVFPETFGLVHAEANAVGTAVMTGKLGANQEVCMHPAEMLDVADNKAVIERLIQWTKYGAPRVLGTAAFRMHRIVREWEDALTV